MFQSYKSTFQLQAAPFSHLLKGRYTRPAIGKSVQPPNCFSPIQSRSRYGHTTSGIIACFRDSARARTQGKNSTPETMSFFVCAGRLGMNCKLLTSWIYTSITLLVIHQPLLRTNSASSVLISNQEAPPARRLPRSKPLL